MIFLVYMYRAGDFLFIDGMFQCHSLSFFCFRAAAILPVVKKQHQLLVTLLLCNACAMEVVKNYVLLISAQCSHCSLICSLFLIPAIAGASYIPWQNFSSLCGCSAVCYVCPCFWGGTMCFDFILFLYNCSNHQGTNLFLICFNRSFRKPYVQDMDFLLVQILCG